MDLTRALRNLFTGVQRQRPPTIRATLTAAYQAYGTWQVTAAALGVSTRTLRRIRAGLISPASRAKIEALSNDPAVRQASVTPTAARRLIRMRTSDTRVRISGVQGPRGYGHGDYTRLRTIDFDIPPHRMLEIADAFFNGDDQEAVALFDDAITEFYGEGSIPGGGWVIEELHSIDMSV